MLGRLTRWLRIMGQDVIYGPELSGAGLLRAARQQGRLILTRDRAVAKRNPPPYLMIRSDHFREQLEQVIDECGLDPMKDAFARCAECNTVLQSVAKSSVEDKVPPYVLATQDKFSFCATCRRIYWPATHQQRMLAELQSLGRK
jgi:hypothetical protein